MANGLYRTLYEFKAETEGDLELHPGDLVKVTSQISDDWLKGVTDCSSGQFPTNYVERIFENVTKRVGIAINDFTAQEEGDVTLKKGDIVCITENIDDNWLSGFTQSDGGIFPLNFIKEIAFLDSDDESLAGHSNVEDIIAHDLPLAEVIENFTAQDSDELTIAVGDKIHIVKEVDNFWLEGILNGRQGKFPKTFVKLDKDLPEHLKFSEKEDDTDDEVPRARAIFMFVGTKQEELSFDKGDIILLTDRINRDWLCGRIGNSVGMFPSNYVEIIMDLPYTPQPEIPNENSITQSPRTCISPNSLIKTKIIAGNIPSVQPQKPKTSPRHSFQKASRPIPPSKPLSPVKPAHRTNGHILTTGNYFYKKTDDELSTTQQHKQIQNIFYQKNEENIAGHNHFNGNNNHPHNNNNVYIRKDHNKNSEKPKPSQKKNSLKKPLTINDVRVLHRVELKDEDVSSLPTGNQKERKMSSPKKPQAPDPKVLSRTLSLSKKPKAPPRPGSFKATKSTDVSNTELDLLSSSPPKGKSGKSLPKPLAPTPHLFDGKEKRPTSLKLTRQSSMNLENNHSPQKSPLSPNTAVIQNSSSVFYTKEIEDFSRLTLPRSETDPQLLKTEKPLQLPLTPDQPRESAVRSMYFATSSPSPEKKRYDSLDAMLQRSSSLRGGVKTFCPLPYKTSTLKKAASSSLDGSTDSLSQQSQELKRIDTAITEIKGKIESEAHLLSGVDTLLDFVSDDKQADLLNKQEQHKTNIVELNEELNALEDEKSYLLASFGKVDDVKNRVSELERQIETYLDNCEKLRRMQDIAVMEELPEIRDNIEFCENMVDTLQDELNGLREKLEEFDETDHQDGAPDPGVPSEKKKANQKRVIEELVNTERSFLDSITLLTKVKDELSDDESCQVNIKILFANLVAVVDLSGRLLENFELSLDEEIEEIPGSVASCFIDVAAEMKECYSTYCHNYEDAQALMEKYEEDVSTWNLIKTAIENVCNQHNKPVFNFSSYLIKPVQRVLKYPLLLSELLKNHGEESINREVIKYALTTVTDVATAINEFKRRKDLVQKYRETEDGISKKVQKLNWHSVAKKSSRINQRITQFTGFNSQTVDEKFIEEEKRFRGLEKLIKSIIKNIWLFLEDFKTNTGMEQQCAESICMFYDEDESSEVVPKYHEAISKITDKYAKEMISFVEINVTDPLKELLALFQGPSRLIQKRNDKCLDYDRAKSKAAKAKDSKERDKISQTQEELQTSQNIYIALNTQLLEELPTLCQKCSVFTKYCMANFAEAYKRFFSNAFAQFAELWELPFIAKNCDMFERHQNLLDEAIQKLTSLSFIPPAGSKDTHQRRNQTQVISNAVLKASLFVDMDNSSEDPTSPLKPLIHISSDESNETSNDAPTNSHDQSSSLMDATIDANIPLEDENPSTWVVTYGFEAESEAEISVPAGAKVSVLRKSDKNGNTEWWLVQYEDQKGFIPESFLREIKRPLTRSMSDSRHLNERQKNGTSTGISDQPILTSEKSLDTTDTSANLFNGTSSLRVGNSQFFTCDNDDKTSVVSDDGRSFVSSEDTRSLESLKSEVSLKSAGLKPSQNASPYYVVGYDFDADNSGELSVKEGDIVNVVRKHDQKGNIEWWFVQAAGEEGYVPRDFLILVDPTSMC